MTFKEISDHLLAGKMVGNEHIGWMCIDPRDGFLVATGNDYAGDDHLIGYLFCSCDELEVRDNELI